VHSGDSAVPLPPYCTEPSRSFAEVEKQTKALALALKRLGLMKQSVAV